MKHKEHDTPVERKVATGISFFFMFLVGMSMPHFIGVNFAETHAGSYSVTGSQEMMSWGMIMFHVVIVSLLSNIGKLCPMFFYRDQLEEVMGKRTRAIERKLRQVEQLPHEESQKILPIDVEDDLTDY